jgi:hypothetical protein
MTEGTLTQFQITSFKKLYLTIKLQTNIRLGILAPSFILQPNYNPLCKHLPKLYPN